MLNDLSMNEAQQIAEELIRNQIENADGLDPCSIAEVLRSSLHTDYVQDFLCALLSIETEQLSEWMEAVLDEPDSDPDY